MSHSTFPNELQRELHHLARFGANITDAHSCCIFLPDQALAPGSAHTHTTNLRLVAWHSLSHDIAEAVAIPVHGGIIGWVASHRRSIHVAPFEQDSNTLGYYRSPIELKSLIGAPANYSESSDPSLAGVVICDSKKSFAFSKLQGKLLEDLAHQIGSTVRLLRKASAPQQQRESLATFLTQAEVVSQELGIGSLEFVRMRVTNVDALENTVGLTGVHEALEQLWRLARQTLPPHFPSYVHVGTELLICCDNMLSQLLENKVRALVDRVFEPSVRPQITFKRSGKMSRSSGRTPVRPLLEEMIASTAPSVEVLARGGLRRGVGSA